MKNLIWILHSVVTLVMYCVLLHFTFKFLFAFNSNVKPILVVFAGFSFIALFIAVVAWIVRNYDWFQCDLFNLES